MKQILTPEQAVTRAGQFHENEERIVLAGGCFDILHVGHAQFLEKAKAAGDTLFVFIESDAHIKQLKGENRPINNQQDRAYLLSQLRSVDYVILLPDQAEDTFYDDLINRLKPAIIATTAGDTHRSHKERQAAHIGAKVEDVLLPVHNQSTTKVLQLIHEE